MIVCYASKLVNPSAFLLMAFLLNSGVSILTGTSFGTAATMGVICAAMGNSIGVNPILTGGAVLSGVYFGDRCSPVSTSALLVAELTGTDIYLNIRRMIYSALFPFFLTCMFYIVIGFSTPKNGTITDLEAIFINEFHLHWITLLPAALILLLSACRVNVKITMAVSILSAIPLCLIIQRIPILTLLGASFSGYYPRDPKIAAMMSGGGIFTRGRSCGRCCSTSGCG